MVLLFLGCVTSTDEKKSGLPGLVVVAPVNFDGVTPEQLKSGLIRSEKLLDLFLRHNKVEVVKIPLEELQTTYLEALDGKNPPPADSAAYSKLMADLLEKFSTRPTESVLIVPNLLYRTATLSGMKGKWDGTVRNIVFENFFSKFDARFHRLNFHEKASIGVSLRIRVFSSDAGLVHEGYGGIELPFKFVGRVRDDVYKADYAERSGEEVFADPKVIARAISVAFSPYIRRAI